MPNLTTLATLKDYVDVRADDAGHDAQLTSLLESVEAQFVRDVGWAILSGDREDFLCGHSGRTYTFGVGPVTTATLARVLDPSGDTWEDLPATSYNLRRKGRMSWIDYRYAFASDSDYRITYTAGYALASIPKDITHCIYVFAAIAYLKAESSGEGRTWDMITKGQSANGASSTIAYKDPAFLWMSTVEAYKVVSV